MLKVFILQEVQLDFCLLFSSATILGTHAKSNAGICCIAICCADLCLLYICRSETARILLLLLETFQRLLGGQLK